MFRLPRITALALGLSLLTAPAMAQQLPGSDVGAKPDASVACHVGVYRLGDGSWIDVAPIVGKGLRWRRPDGSSGRMTVDAEGRWTSTLGGTGRVEGPQPQLGRCEDGRVVFESAKGERMKLDIRDTTFVGQGGTRLNGRLLLPPGSGPVPIMIEVHGSEGANAIDFNIFQRLAPADGVGVFVYAKRGSGGSEGRYTQDFHVLAEDAAAAVVEARRLAGPRTGRVGMHGGSQAGWIEPLAAARTPVDFVVIDFGLAYGALQQESDLVARHMAARGWGPDVIEQGRAVAAAVGRLVAINGADGFGELDAVRAANRAQPWYADVKGDFTGMLLNTSNEQIVAMLPQYDVGTSWTYDPLPTLRTLNTPMLWILAEEDSRAPSAPTRARLGELAAQGRPITVLQYPATDHGMVRFETDAQGKRTSLGNPPGYFRAVEDWARRGRLDGAYGDGRLMTPVRR